MIAVAIAVMLVLLGFVIFTTRQLERRRRHAGMAALRRAYAEVKTPSTKALRHAARQRAFYTAYATELGKVKREPAPVDEPGLTLSGDS